MSSRMMDEVVLGEDVTDPLRALPAECYVSHDVMVLEQERLFFKTWQYACHVSAIDVRGSYVSVSVMGQNVIVLRDHNDEVRAFYNVCPHRGHKLVEGTGKKRVIVCPYHHWNFALDGRLKRSPKTEASDAPSDEVVCLTPVRVDRFLDFIFVNLDPDAIPMSEYWPGVEEHILSVCPDVGTYTLSTSASVIQPTDVAANWKVQVDNFLECQHCRGGHKSFSDMLDVANQKLSLGKNSSYSFIPSAGKADNLAYPLNPDHDVMDLHFWYLFPNTGFGQFSGPGNLSLFQWIPVSPDRAIRINVSLDAPEITDPGMLERRERRAIWGRDVLQPEDISFMLSVQEGMSQRCFKQGWYIVDWDNQEASEAMVRHFHETYRQYMGGLS